MNAGGNFQVNIFDESDRELPLGEWGEIFIGDIVEELPQSAGGKILKRILREKE